ncbi:Docking protein 3 [Oopsacas minuta]|uniref:Docking protein 3 n=1 Tax=Oopsacas minuta TaxID=111878 RepID=A0AAV7JGK8_9METZ|nr:Docking protein 3 [Oopsacas minuta]
MSKIILKEGFVKVLSGEKNIFTVGSIKLGKKTKWNKQYLKLAQDEKDKRLQIWIFDTPNGEYKDIPKSIFSLDSNTQATQMAVTYNEQFCCIISSSKETLTISCDYYGELLDWISYIKRNVSAFSRGRLPAIPKDEDIRKEWTRGVSDPGVNRGMKENKTDSVTNLRKQNYECPVRVTSTFEIENNHIYGDSNIFSVEIEQNETSERLKLSGGYNLILLNDGIQLTTQDSKRVIYFWHVKVLRRFGSSNSRFSIESGRSSQSGVGNFVFFTPSCKLINEKVTDMTERIKHNKSSGDVVRIESRTTPTDISPLTQTHSATRVQTSIASEKFAQKEREYPKESIRPNPISSVDSLNENAFYPIRVNNEREKNLITTKKSLPPESGNISDYSLNEIQKKPLIKIRSSQTSDADSNTIELNTKPTTVHIDRPDYVNFESYLRATADVQDPSISDAQTPMNAEDYRKMLPIAFERMRSESEPTPPKICLPREDSNSMYVNLQNILPANPDDKIPMAREYQSNSVENLRMSPERPSHMQKSVHSLSTQNLAGLSGNQDFEIPSDTNLQPTALPKSLSLMQITHRQGQPQQQQQYYPPQQQQFYPQHPCLHPPTFIPQQFHTEPNQQQYPRGVDRFYQQPPQQQIDTHRQVMYQTNTEFPYLQQLRLPYAPSVCPPDSFQPTRQYPRSAPSSGMIDAVQRPAIRDVYPCSAPNTGSHSMQRDIYKP